MKKTKNYRHISEITEQLEKGIQELFKSDKYKLWLQTMSKFHNYSLNNTLLITFQRPDATMVAGYASWKRDFDRLVKKGEKAIQIFAPVPYKKKIEVQKLDPITQMPMFDINGNAIVEIKEITISSFRRVNVFDISQTEGKELPRLGVDELKGKVQNFDYLLEILKQISPVPVSFKQIEGGAKGYYSQTENKIVVQEGMSQIQTIKTLIHETAHAKLHSVENAKYTNDKRQSRNSKEVEAESVAYTVCQHFDIDTSEYSFAYIAGWSSGKDIKELKESLQRIQETSSNMISDIEKQLERNIKQKSVLLDLKDKKSLVQNNQEACEVSRKSVLEL